MLESIYDGRVTRRNIHAQGVADFRKTAGEPAYQAIADWVLSLFGQQEWVNTTFVSPPVWQGTPLLPAWDYFHRVRDHDERHELAAKLYGAVFYTVLFERPEIYLYHRHEGHHSDDARPYGLTYKRK